MAALVGSMSDTTPDREITQVLSSQKRCIRYGLLALVIIVLAIPFVLAVYFA